MAHPFRDLPLLAVLLLLLCAAVFVLEDTGPGVFVSAYSYPKRASTRSPASTTKFTVKNNRILDEFNRELFFHGLNVVYKSPPYLPILDHFDANLSFAEYDMHLFKSLGLNIMRLGVMWPGVNPAANYYNQTYIDLAASLIATAYSQYNIFTLVDCHQDVLSECLCGEGAPNYAIEPLRWNFPEPLGPPYVIPANNSHTHIPSRSDCLSKSWASYYTTMDTSMAFQRIYKNVNNLGDLFGEYWGVLALNLRDVSGVLGFELMNEPWAGDIYENPFLMYPGKADEKNLQPFYDMVVPYIYSNDSSRLVFFESVTWTDEFNVSLDSVGFTHVPGGQQYSNRSVFSFHYYNPPNAGSERKYFSARTENGIAWNATSMLTEFGIGNGEGTPKTMDLCDEFLVSWIGWEYKKLAGSLPDGTCTGCGYGLFEANGDLNTGVAKAVSRTYAQKVAGNTLRMYFDRTNGDFQLVFRMDVRIQEPSVIYASLQYWYTDAQGFDVAVNVSSKVLAYNVTQDVSGDFSMVYLHNTNEQQFAGTVVQVDITSK